MLYKVTWKTQKPLLVPLLFSPSFRWIRTVQLNPKKALWLSYLSPPPPPPPAARVHFPLSFNYHTISKYLWSAYYVSNSMGCQTCCPLCLKYTSHVHLSWMNYSPAFKCLPQPLCEGFPNPLGSQTSLPLYYEHHFTVQYKPYHSCCSHSSVSSRKARVMPFSLPL